MRLIFEDHFETGLKAGWGYGVRPDGTQWGSAAHFATKAEGADVYTIAEPSILRMRAIHNPNYVDPENWGRKWKSALLCTARPDGGVATFRRGYIEAKVKLPTGRGRWPSLWATDLANDENGAKKWGAVEIDMEWYNQEPEGVHGSYYVNCGCINHLPNGAGHGPDTTPEGILVDGRLWRLYDMSQAFHVIGIKVGDSTVSWFLDGQQIAERPLPRATTVGKFYWMLNLGLTSDWPVSVPPEGHTDMLVDYVRVWSAD